VNRRDGLKLLIAAPVGGSLLSANGADAIPEAIYDGRFAEARALARRSLVSHDCQRDAAGLWYARFAARTDRSRPLRGLTTQADAMVLADCARREGLLFAQLEPARSDGLVAWVIARKGFS
jgi:hypothetical protein